MTDRTPARHLQVLDNTVALIDEHGWALIAVAPAQGDSGVSFTYTVGLTAQFLPELVVYGLEPSSAGALLNAAATHMVATGELKPGDRLDGVLADGRQVAIIDIAAEDIADFAMVHNIYGAVLSARQVVWPDSDGKFPWEKWSCLAQQPLSGGPPF